MRADGTLVELGPQASEYRFGDGARRAVIWRHSMTGPTEGLQLVLAHISGPGGGRSRAADGGKRVALHEEVFALCMSGPTAGESLACVGSPDCNLRSAFT